MGSLQGSVTLPAALGEKYDSYGGALSFSCHLQPPIKNSNSQQLMYLLLCRMEEAAVRRQWQLGRGWGRVQGAICLVLPAPRPAGKWCGPS